MPTANSPLAAIDASLDRARKIASTISWSNFGDQVGEIILLGVERAFDLENTGAEKKELVLGWVSDLVDALALNLPIPFLPASLRQWIVSKLIKPRILAAADGMIEAAYRKLKSLRTA